MTHMPGVPIQGDDTSEKPVDCPCRKCGEKQVTMYTWESSCGGYEDYRFTCRACKATWWVDGIDS
jgi:hypothetical protein